MLPYARRTSTSASLCLAVVACIYAAPAQAVSLADLAAGSDFVSGMVTYSNFEVKVSGKGLSSDLELYLVTPSADNGFEIVLADGAIGKKGKLRLEYDASSAQGLEGAALSPEPSGGVLKIQNKLKGEKKLGKLFFNNGKPNQSLALEFDDPVDTFHVKSKIKALASEGGTSIVSQSTATVPEPGTAALLALGVLGLAARRRIAA